MKRLALILAALLALVVIATAYASEKVPVCHNPNNWHLIVVDSQAVPALMAQGDFIVDDTHPCPPESNSNPNPGDPQEPENWLEIYLPVIYGNNLY